MYVATPFAFRREKGSEDVTVASTTCTAAAIVVAHQSDGRTAYFVISCLVSLAEPRLLITDENVKLHRLASTLA